MDIRSVSTLRSGLDLYQTQQAASRESLNAAEWFGLHLDLRLAGSSAEATLRQINLSPLVAANFQREVEVSNSNGKITALALDPGLNLDQVRALFTFTGMLAWEGEGGVLTVTPERRDRLKDEIARRLDAARALFSANRDWHQQRPGNIRKLAEQFAALDPSVLLLQANTYDDILHSLSRQYMADFESKRELGRDRDTDQTSVLALMLFNALLAEKLLDDYWRVLEYLKAKKTARNTPHILDVLGLTEFNQEMNPERPAPPSPRPADEAFAKVGRGTLDVGRGEVERGEEGRETRDEVLREESQEEEIASALARAREAAVKRNQRRMVRLLELLLGKYPDDPRVYQGMAQVYAAAGDVDKARESELTWARRLAELGRIDEAITAYLEIAGRLVTSGDRCEARRILDLLIDKFPEEKRVYEGAAKLGAEYTVSVRLARAAQLMGLGRYGEAIEHYQFVGTVDADNPAWFDGMAKAYLAKGDLVVLEGLYRERIGRLVETTQMDKALAVCERMSTDFPQNPAGPLEATKIHLTLSDEESALRCYMEALRRNHNLELREMLNLIGRLPNEQYILALDALELILELVPEIDSYAKAQIQGIYINCITYILKHASEPQILCCMEKPLRRRDVVDERLRNLGITVGQKLLEKDNQVYAGVSLLCAVYQTADGTTVSKLGPVLRTKAVQIREVLQSAFAPFHWDTTDVSCHAVADMMMACFGKNDHRYAAIKIGYLVAEGKLAEIDAVVALVPAELRNKQAVSEALGRARAVGWVSAEEKAAMDARLREEAAEREGRVTRNEGRGTKDVGRGEATEANRQVDVSEPETENPEIIAQRARDDKIRPWKGQALTRKITLDLKLIPRIVFAAKERDQTIREGFESDEAPGIAFFEKLVSRAKANTDLAPELFDPEIEYAYADFIDSLVIEITRTRHGGVNHNWAEVLRDHSLLSRTYSALKTRVVASRSPGRGRKRVVDNTPLTSRFEPSLINLDLIDAMLGAAEQDPAISTDVFELLKKKADELMPRRPELGFRFLVALVLYKPETAALIEALNQLLEKILEGAIPILEYEEQKSRPALPAVFELADLLAIRGKIELCDRLYNLYTTVGTRKVDERLAAYATYNLGRAYLNCLLREPESSRKEEHKRTAEEKFKLALAADPEADKYTNTTLSARVNLGVIYTLNGKYADAASLLEAVVEKSPRYVYAVKRQWFNARHAGQTEQASAYFEQAITLDPLNFGSYVDFATSLFYDFNDEPGARAVIELFFERNSERLALTNFQDDVLANLKGNFADRFPIVLDLIPPQYHPQVAQALPRLWPSRIPKKCLHLCGEVL